MNKITGVLIFFILPVTLAVRANAQQAPVPAPDNTTSIITKSTPTVQAAQSKPKNKLRSKTTPPPAVAGTNIETTQKAPRQETPQGILAPEKKHTVVKHDTLWALADRYYANPFKWGSIYNANLTIIKEPDLINPGEELTIPERLRETPYAAPIKTATRTQTELPVAEPAVAVVTPITEAAPAVAAPLLPRQPGTKATEIIPSNYTGLSEEMPEDQTGWVGAALIISGNWRKDGKVTGIEAADKNSLSLTEPGDIINLSITSGMAVAPGDTFKTYMKGAMAFDKQGKRLGKALNQTGIVSVLSVSGKNVRARILKANTSVSRGQIIKK